MLTYAHTHIHTRTQCPASEEPSAIQTLHVSTPSSAYCFLLSLPTGGIWRILEMSTFKDPCFFPRLGPTGPLLLCVSMQPSGQLHSPLTSWFLCPPLLCLIPGLWACTHCSNLDPGPESLGPSKPLPTCGPALGRPFPWPSSRSWL